MGSLARIASTGVGYARHHNPQEEVIEVRTLPTTMIPVLVPFAPLFSRRVWQHALVLQAGTILAPSKRTVATALRAMGLQSERTFHRYPSGSQLCHLV
jgi:hypothetical protein